MNTVNASTSFTGFQLWTGQTPHSLLATGDIGEDLATQQALDILARLENDVGVAKDNLLLAKITQGAQENKHHSCEYMYHVGDQVMLLTCHRW